MDQDVCRAGVLSHYVTTQLFVPCFAATPAVDLIALSGARDLSGERAVSMIKTLFVVVIRSAMVYLEIDAMQQQTVHGLVLIAAIALTIDRANLRRIVK